MTDRDVGQTLLDLANWFQQHDIIPFVLQIPPRTRCRDMHRDLYRNQSTKANRQTNDRMRSGRYIGLPMSMLVDCLIDGVHFSAVGYEIIASAIRDRLHALHTLLH